LLSIGTIFAGVHGFLRAAVPCGTLFTSLHPEHPSHRHIPCPRAFQQNSKLVYHTIQRQVVTMNFVWLLFHTSFSEHAHSDLQCAQWTFNHPLEHAPSCGASPLQACGVCRQLYVLDTYADAHNRVVNHALAALLSVISIVIVVTGVVAPLQYLTMCIRYSHKLGSGTTSDALQVRSCPSVVLLSESKSSASSS
jgi:hypothetical protein